MGLRLFGENVLQGAERCLLEVVYVLCMSLFIGSYFLYKLVVCLDSLIHLLLFLVEVDN